MAQFLKKILYCHVDQKNDSTIYNYQSLTLGKNSHPYVDVYFDRLKATSVWDTGSGITVADINFIRKNSTYFQEIGSSNGTDSNGSTMQTPLFLMQPTMIGNRVFSSHKVAGVDLSHVNSTTEIPMDLILGYSTLRKANWLFDFPRKKWAIISMTDCE